MFFVFIGVFREGGGYFQIERRRDRATVSLILQLLYVNGVSRGETGRHALWVCVPACFFQGSRGRDTCRFLLLNSINPLPPKYARRRRFDPLRDHPLTLKQ